MAWLPPRGRKGVSVGLWIATHIRTESSGWDAWVWKRLGCVFPSLHVPPSPLQAPRGASTCLSLSSAPSRIDTPPELPLPPNLRKFIAERTSETSLGSHLHMKKTEPTGEVTCPALKRQRWYLDPRLLLCSPVPRPHPGLIHVSFPVPGFLLCLLPMALGVFKTGPWPDGMWKGWRLLSRNLVPDVTSPEVALRAPALPAPPPLYRKSSFPDSPGQVCPSCCSCLHGLGRPA